MSDKVWDSLYLSAEEKVKTPPPQLVFKKRLLNGKILEFNGPTTEVTSAVLDRETGRRIKLGEIPRMNKEEALEALTGAVAAYNNGKGAWPNSDDSERLAALEKFVVGLKGKKKDIVPLLSWEICKSMADAEKEVDRTIEYIELTIKELKDLRNREGTFVVDSGVIAHVRRAPLGVVLVMGPFNYPFNETYTTLIPALIMGNTAVMKLPSLGGLCHCPTLELFAECFPPGVINVITGSGREVIGPIMGTGKVDVFAFIGTSKAADTLQRLHPCPHRLRVCLGLEAKNPAIVLEDADLEVATRECVAGSLTYNGQRCTALKILFVHKSISEKFVKDFCQKVDELKIGLPTHPNVKITPLAEESKPEWLRNVIGDAVSKGAKIVNNVGGKIDRTFVAPTVLFPVDHSMKIYHEEQFGPVVPIATFEDLEEVYNYLAESPYGQQASVFGKDYQKLSKLIDVLVNQVARVNLNSQCQRGPDSLPFTGRKDSAYGTLSISDALRVFSIRSLVAAKKEKANETILNQILSSQSSHFLSRDYYF